MITATFSITLTVKFLPVQLIYGGKTKKSILTVYFPSDFAISANEKHSNEREALNMLENAIIPYGKLKNGVLHLILILIIKLS